MTPWQSRTTQLTKRMVTMVTFGKRPKTLPEVLSGVEVTLLVECTTNIKHRAFILTLYSASLRLNEGRTSDCRFELPLGRTGLLRRAAAD